MAKRTVVKLNSAEFEKAFLQSPQVRRAVHDAAADIAARVQGSTGDPVEVTDAGISRARSYVTRLGSGAAGEAKDGALLRSIR